MIRCKLIFRYRITLDFAASHSTLHHNSKNIWATVVRISNCRNSFVIHYQKSNKLSDQFDTKYLIASYQLSNCILYTQIESHGIDNFPQLYTLNSLTS